MAANRCRAMEPHDQGRDRETVPLRKPRSTANTPCRLPLASGPTAHRTVVCSHLTYNFARRLKTLSGLTPYEYTVTDRLAPPS